MKCDLCGQRGIALAGESNEMVVCIDHAGRVVAEHQWNALEMARKADAAERRAEEAECHVEQLKSALTRAERKVEAVEALATEWGVLTQGGDFVGGGGDWHRRGRDRAGHRHRVAPAQAHPLAPEVPCPTCGASMRFCECMDDPFAIVPCDHEWHDRPESDTRECLICGAEESM